MPDVEWWVKAVSIFVRPIEKPLGKILPNQATNLLWDAMAFGSILLMMGFVTDQHLRAAIWTLWILLTFICVLYVCPRL